MKKRWIAICTAIVLAFGLVGCGGGNSSSGGDNTSSGAISGETSGEASAGTEYTLDQVVYDQEGVAITATGYRIDENESHYLVLEVENSTESMVGLDCSSLTINGLQISDGAPSALNSLDVEMMLSIQKDAMPEDSEEEWDAFLEDYYHVVEAGETKEVEINLYLSDAQAACIGTIQQLELSMTTIKFTDPDDKDTLGAEDMPLGEVVTIQTDKFEDELVLPEIEGEEIYNKEGIRLVLLGVEYNESSETLYVNIYTENNSDKVLSLSENSVTLNDFVEESYMDFAYGLKKGLRAVSRLSLYDVDIESMEDVENLEFTIDISDDETYETIDTVTYTYEP